MDRDVVRQAALSAMEAGLRFATEHLLEGSETLDSHNWFPNNLSVDERRRLLDNLSGRARGSWINEHLGEPPIRADSLTHSIMFEHLRKHVKLCYVVGEEATEEDWDAAQGAPIDSIIFQIDPIDGSLPYETLTFAYSVNLLAYIRERDQDSLIFAGVANSSGLVAFYSEGGVAVGDFANHQTLTAPLKSPEDLRPDSIAALGALPRHRELIDDLLRDDGLTVFTTGGAPASLGLILGNLGALIATRPQTSHDAAYLPILAALGIPIYVEGGMVLDLNDVLGFFNHVARNQSDRTDHPVPRFIAARNPAVGASLARRLLSRGVLG